MKKKILIAEDNAYVSTLLLHFLGKEYDVTLTINGQEALEWLQEGNKPDLIISDIMMPKIDGWTLLANVRASAYFRDIPVMMLSGLEKSQERIKCFELGANDYMVKPFNPQELIIRIANVLKTENHART